MEYQDNNKISEDKISDQEENDNLGFYSNDIFQNQQFEPKKKSSEYKYSFDVPNNNSHVFPPCIISSGIFPL